MSRSRFYLDRDSAGRSARARHVQCQACGPLRQGAGGSAPWVTVDRQAEVPPLSGRRKLAPGSRFCFGWRLRRLGLFNSHPKAERAEHRHHRWNRRVALHAERFVQRLPLDAGGSRHIAQPPRSRLSASDRAESVGDRGGVAAVECVVQERDLRLLAVGAEPVTGYGRYVATPGSGDLDLAGASP